MLFKKVGSRDRIVSIAILGAAFLLGSNDSFAQEPTAPNGTFVPSQEISELNWFANFQRGFSDETLQDMESSLNATNLGRQVSTKRSLGDAFAQHWGFSILGLAAGGAAGVGLGAALDASGGDQGPIMGMAIGGLIGGLIGTPLGATWGGKLLYRERGTFGAAALGSAAGLGAGLLTGLGISQLMGPGSPDGAIPIIAAPILLSTLGATLGYQFSAKRDTRDFSEDNVDGLRFDISAAPRFEGGFELGIRAVF